VSERAVTTDAAYLATERGQILEVNFPQMQHFRKSTLYDLLEQSHRGQLDHTSGMLSSLINMPSARGRSSTLPPGVASHKQGSKSLVRNIMDSKLREQRLRAGTDMAIPEYSHEESDIDAGSQRGDLELGNFKRSI